MFINGDGAKRAARRLLEQSISKQLNTITILHQVVDGRRVFQWGGNTGEWFSPPLPSMEIAFQYPVTHGLKVWTPPEEV